MVSKGNKIYTFFMCMAIVFFAESSVFATKNNYWCSCGGADETKCSKIIEYVDACVVSINDNASLPLLQTQIFHDADDANCIYIGTDESQANLLQNRPCLSRMLNNINNKIQSLQVTIENKNKVEEFLRPLFSKVYSAVSYVKYEDLQRNISRYVTEKKVPSVIVNFYNAVERIKQDINKVDQEIRRQAQEAQRNELTTHYHQLLQECTAAILEYEKLPLTENNEKCQRIRGQLAAIANQLSGVELPSIPQLFDGFTIDSEDAIKVLVEHVITSLHNNIEQYSAENNDIFNSDDIASGDLLLKQAVGIERGIVEAFNNAHKLRDDFCQHFASHAKITFDEKLWDAMCNEIIVKFCATPSLISKTIQEKDCFGWALRSAAYDTIKKPEHSVNINSRCGFYGKVIIGVAVTVAVIMYIAFMHSK